MSEIVNFLAGVPIWAWVIFGLFILLFLLGDPGVWDYEVKFPRQPGVGGDAEVEIECWKRKGAYVTARFALEERFKNRPIEISLGGEHLLTVPAEQNTGVRCQYKVKYEGERPKAGSRIDVQVDGETLYSGALVVD